MFWSNWVGKSDLHPWSNLGMLWVLEEQNQHDVTCYNPKRDAKRRSYHGRSTNFRIFDAAPRALILCQTRSLWLPHGSIRFQFPAVLERYHSNDQTLTKTCTFVRKTMGLPRWGYNSTRMIKGYQSALKDKDVSWPHAHSPESRCWLTSMRQAQMPQFQEAISSVQLDWFRLVQGSMNRICLRASLWCCFSFSLGPVQEQRHPASHRPRPFVWFAKWLSWRNSAVLVDQDWCSASFRNYPDVFCAVGRFAWQLVLPKT